MTATRIARSTPEDIEVRGRSLPAELMGKLGFTEMAFFHIVGRVPSAGERDAVDACLVALMEHGLTPSVIAARLVYSSAPEAVQGAVPRASARWAGTSTRGGPRGRSACSSSWRRRVDAPPLEIFRKVPTVTVGTRAAAAGEGRGECLSGRP